MAGIQVVNMRKVGGSGGNLGKHIDGLKRPVTAAPRDGIAAVTYLDAEGEELRVVASLSRRTERGTKATAVQPGDSRYDYSAEEWDQLSKQAADNREMHAMKRIDECRQKPVRGRKPAPCVAFMFGGPPPYGAPDAWDQQTIRAWAAGCVRWAVRKAGQGSRIAHCALHQDETSPHVHLVLVAADERGRLGWNRIRQGFGITGRERGPELMSAMQTSFHREVGHQFGLERGGPSSRSREPIDRMKGLAARIKEERERADELTAERNEARDMNDRVFESLSGLGRAALEKVAAAGGFDGKWLAKKVKRDRGMDR